MGDQDQAGRARGETLDVLQVKAEQETDGERGAVVDQRRQVGKGENSVAAEPAAPGKSDEALRDSQADEQQERRRGNMSIAAPRQPGSQVKPSMKAVSIRL